MMSFRPRTVRLFASAFLLSMMAGAAGAAAPAAAGDAKAAAAPNTAAVSPDGLISRSVLFGNPDRTALRVSPDGKRVAFIAPVAGVLNVWVAPINDIAAAKPVTKDTSRGIRQYFWAYNNNDLLYLQDVGGDENWKVYRVNLETSKVTDLTPFETINGPDGKPIMLPTGQPLRPAAQIEAVSHKFPNHILIGLNNRNPQFHDIYRVDLSTGALTLLFTNDQWASISTDDNYDIRLASKMTSDGGIEYFKAATTAAKPGKESEPASITFESFIKVSQQDSMTTSPMGFSKDGQTLYMLDSRDRNTAALVSKDLKTGKITLLAEDAKADAGGVMMHPTEKTVQAVSFEYMRDEWKVLDKSIEPDLAYLRTVSEGDMNVTSRSLDDKTWVVAFAQDKGPARSYIYDRAAKKATFAFSNKQSLEGLPLQAMKPVVIKSRDGLDLVSYLTLPMGSDKNNDGKPDAPVPLVLNVHGGPWARDSWGLDPEAQWLANRGYACLQVNFRGSTGFGKSFINAADKQWSKKMHDDLIDAVNWAVKEGIADPSKVAIYGGSYGGYSALVGVTFTPDTFACSVAIVGPSSLQTLLESIPPYWAPAIEMFAARVGDMRTEEGRKFLAECSPLTYVDRIKKPLLIGQGKNDPRVKFTESEQIVDAMKKKGIPVTYVLYPDEGHGFARPENRMSFYAVTEAFLAKHLGGKVQPVGEDFKGSTIQIPAGAEDVPGISGAIGSAGKK